MELDLSLPMYGNIDAEVSQSNETFLEFSGFKGYKHLIYKFDWNELAGETNVTSDQFREWVFGRVWEEGYMQLVKRLECFTFYEESILDECKRPYNMVVGRGWILLALRSKGDAWDRFGMNACMFLGGLLVKNETDLEELAGISAEKILEEV
jgi:hypothetical protein